MKNPVLYFLAILILFFSKTCVCQTGWNTITNIDNVDLHKTLFLNENTGFTVGLWHGEFWVIYKTVNGGINWMQTRQEPPITGDELYSIGFINQNTGYAVGGDLLFGGYLFLKTTNTGNSWTQQSLGISSNTLNDIKFFNESTGYITGTSGLILQTTNGGLSWVQQISNSIGSLSDIQIIQSNPSCVYLRRGYSGFLRTSNGGINWEEFSFETGVNILSISFVNPSTGYAAGNLSNFPYTSVLYKTTNSGSNWTSLSGYLPSQNSSGRVYFINESTGLFIGRNVYKTTTSGLSWKAQESFPWWTLYNDISFIDNNTGYVTCSWQSIYNGIILKTNSFGDGVPNAPSNLIARRQYGINRLQWTDNSVTETGFVVQRKLLGDTTWQSIFSPGANTVNHNDSEGTANDKYRVYAQNEFGISSYSNEAIPVIININENLENIAEKYLLPENYPNPFNPTTTIKFIVNKNITGIYFIKIYNQLGQLVDIIQFNINGKGIYQAKWNAVKYSSGIYYYRVELDGETLTGKMVLMK